MEEDYNNESDAGNGPEFDVDDLFDSDDDDAAAALDEGIDEDAGYDSGYGTKERDVTMINNINNYSTAEVDELGELLWLACDTAKLDKFGEVVWKYKALCYKDIYF
jgi:hypothetical protein